MTRIKEIVFSRVAVGKNPIWFNLLRNLFLRKQPVKTGLVWIKSI